MLETPSINVDAIRLEVVMHKRGETLAGMARKMGCHVNTLHRIKSTGKVSLPTLEAICELLECHPFDLLVARGYPEVRLPRMGESLFLKNGDW